MLTQLLMQRLRSSPAVKALHMSKVCRTEKECMRTVAELFIHQTHCECVASVRAKDVQSNVLPFNYNRIAHKANNSFLLFD